MFNRRTNVALAGNVRQKKVVDSMKAAVFFLFVSCSAPNNQERDKRMRAQVYSDGTLRIFDRKGCFVCDMHISAPLKSSADGELKRLRLVRRQVWKDHPSSRMSEARIRFRWGAFCLTWDRKKQTLRLRLPPFFCLLCAVRSCGAWQKGIIPWFRKIPRKQSIPWIMNRCCTDGDTQRSVIRCSRERPELTLRRRWKRNGKRLEMQHIRKPQHV